jgi:NAD(P)-dependent dehydrogenase (short-subunit alcohol dehydrogenase family)
MQRIIVMTGGTSGLGRVAANRFVEEGMSVFAAVRNTPLKGTQGIVANLTRLADVRALAQEVTIRLEGCFIDALVLNAGGYGNGRTPEGYDGTFVLNYLSHFLLISLLWERIAENGCIVLTTSGTHDPAEQSLAPAPRHANAEWLARPELDPERDPSPRTAAARAYAAAKLCVVLHARALASREEIRRRGIQVLAYDPGPTPGTGLARFQPAPVRVLWEQFPGVVRWLLRAKANTVEDAGNTLARLALREIPLPDGAIYAALRRGRLTSPSLSVYARRDDLMEALERDSATLIAPTTILS